MKVRYASPSARAPLVVLLLTEDDARSRKAVTVELGDEARAFVERVARSEGFAGKVEQLVMIHVPEGSRTLAVMLVGLGPTADVSPATVRAALGNAVRRVPEGMRRGKPALLALDGARAPWKRGPKAVSLVDAVQAAAEGWVLGAYEQTAHHTQKKSQPVPRLDVRASSLGSAGASTTALRQAVRRGQTIAEGVNLARDLANAPGNVIEPASLARRARQLARASGLSCRVLDKAALERERMGALLGVGQGSDIAPRFITLEYKPRGRGASRPPLVFVGKAITFDSGGISIKPAPGMEEMKFDMSGGAAVIAAMTVIARLKPRCRVVGLVPTAENMLGGGAIKPGDVLRSRSGLTIEVVNTDAEGRLILADALDWARGLEPRLVVDLATLTGACVVALGDVVSGVMTNDRGAVETVSAAATAAGEPVWELPLLPDYHEALKSDTADLKNSGGRPAGAITAGAFLSRFAAGVPWVHVDIAGTAWRSKQKGELPRGATGVGVRTLVRLALDA